MKEMEKRKGGLVLPKDQRKVSAKPIKQEKKDTRSLKARDSVKTRSTTEAESTKVVNDSNTGSGRGTESLEVFEDVSIGDQKDIESKKGIDEVSSDCDSINESVSSQGGELSDSCFQSAPGKSEVAANNTMPLERASESDDVKYVESMKHGSENTEVNGKLCDVPDQGNRDEEIVKPKVKEEVEDKETDVVCKKILEMETRIEKLEEELREVAALEIALYSVVPEHGSSAHKVHTPSRRLCRLYIHACKHLSSKNRATIAKNTVSGLILIAKSCGNDVPRLMFWLSNTVVLREIICQAFGISYEKSFHSNADESSYMSLIADKTTGNNNPKKQGIVQGLGDWQETRTFTAALEKVESWIFSRIVESIWWQTLTPTMQSLSSETVTSSSLPGKNLGPSLREQQQGSHCINLWTNAFQDAIKKLCPVRGEGHECGCLPVLAKKVMEQCLARLDVAMFNAILRESVHEIPTDPVSDPIVDSRVLPISAGDLSFGSGAQLKNCVGNWTIWLQNMFGTDSNDREKVDENKNEIDDKLNGDDHLNDCFLLLNSLSDLLMLPKDMLLDKSVRMEVCPQISLPLVKRILCNFTPDELCPDHVSGAVLEALNTEHIIEHNVSKETARCFPYSAAPVEYTPPSLASVATKIAEVGSGQLQLSRSASTIQNKGYTSDEDLQELDSPLEIIVQKVTPSSGNLANESSCNLRYELLRKVWSA